MNTHNAGSAKITILLGGVLVYGLLCVPANAEAAKPPSRIANIYDGFDHQPTRSDIEDRERAAGVSPSTRQQSSDDAALQQLYQQLRAGSGTG